MKIHIDETTELNDPLLLQGVVMDGKGRGWMSVAIGDQGAEQKSFFNSVVTYLDSIARLHML